MRPKAHHLELINKVPGPATVGYDPFELESIVRKLDSLVKSAERAKAGIDLALIEPALRNYRPILMGNDEGHNRLPPRGPDPGDGSIS